MVIQLKPHNLYPVIIWTLFLYVSLVKPKGGHSIWNLAFTAKSNVTTSLIHEVYGGLRINK
jgi:hypothetical protein